MLGVANTYTDDLAKASWNGLISIRNGVKKLCGELEELKAKIEELQA